MQILLVEPETLAAICVLSDNVVPNIAGSSVFRVIGTPASNKPPDRVSLERCDCARTHIARDADLQRNVILAQVVHQLGISAARMPCPIRTCTGPHRRPDRFGSNGFSGMRKNARARAHEQAKISVNISSGTA